MVAMTSTDDSLGPGLTLLTLIAALGSAAMAGVFFTFSGFVLAGLKRLPRPRGSPRCSPSTSPRSARR